MNTDCTFDTLRALIHEHGPVAANKIARRIARALDALRALNGAQ